MPRCHSCGATAGASLMTSSNPDVDSAMRPRTKSETARSRMSRGCCATMADPATANTIIARATRDLRNTSNRPLFTADVAGRGRSGCSRCGRRETRPTTPGRRGLCLRGPAHVPAASPRGSPAQGRVAALAQNHEPIAGERHRSRQKSILIPAYLPGPQFDCRKLWPNSWRPWNPYRVPS